MHEAAILFVQPSLPTAGKNKPLGFATESTCSRSVFRAARSLCLALGIQPGGSEQAWALLHSRSFPLRRGSLLLWLGYSVCMACRQFTSRIKVRDLDFVSAEVQPECLHAVRQQCVSYFVLSHWWRRRNGHQDAPDLTGALAAPDARASLAA